MTEQVGTGSAYTDDELHEDLRWWAAANYLTVAQIYLQDNVLLREPLRAEHIKPRLLGHWGTSPGLSMIYTILNRHIVRTDTDWIYIAGPGHGGPAIVASTYLEGTYSEIYPEVSLDEAGVRALCRQFSTPGGIPSHVSVETPGSIHEGGELGYALVHAAGAAFDNPDLMVACVIGDGESETGPLSASWKLPAFLNPARDGAVLPILHLNGAKISGPTVPGRTPTYDVTEYLSGQGWDAIEVAGDDPEQVFRDFQRAVDESYVAVRALQERARGGEEVEGIRWPAIVLRTPKGWTGPHKVDGELVEGTFRAHQVPLHGVRDNPEHLAELETWMRSYAPQEIFDDAGAVAASVRALAPSGDKRMGASPYANGGRVRTELPLPAIADYALDVDPEAPGATVHETTRVLGEFMRDIYRATTTADGGGTFRLFCPDETHSNRLGAVFEATARAWQLPIEYYDDDLSPTGRVMEVLSEHLCEGWLEGYLLTGRHGLFASYEAFTMVCASMIIQHVKWLQHAHELEWRAPVSSLNVLLTSTCWRNDHNGFSHQGPGMIDALIPLSPEVVRIWLPPDSNTLLSISNHCFRSVDHVNLIVVDKQPHLQYLTLDAAEEHCAAGASIWRWASTEREGGRRPDIVLACAGDVPTQELLAAAQLLRDHTPDLVTRVVNVVDLMGLLPPADHPHGFSDEKFESLFTDDVHCIFAFHGYSRAVHELLHGRPDADRFHVRGFMEQGTTTTPFDMVVLNRMSRYHLALEAVRRATWRPDGADELENFCRSQLDRHRSYVVEHLEDMPEVRDWRWS
ncbi:phosphoketolase family protein [Rhodococcus rhodnii]|uniref:Putative phosphoketolase n=1 Tax=Rhodococcus rhodnii LMG 5362 TaxID=1273125 RepID=R7WIA5_9NOCA|nr:phosphoketolase family protein [Rhodococcus rhodnii]EOM74916.1 putative phosphoketolase [Rhodococcus rhodnii LMG 5362]